MQANEVYPILREYAGEDYGSVWSYLKIEQPVIDHELCQISVVTTYGGEGQGDVAYLVLQVDSPDGVQYFRKDGYYASYYGFEWDGDFSEVIPREKIVVLYDEVVKTNVYGD